MITRFLQFTLIKLEQDGVSEKTNSTHIKIALFTQYPIGHPFYDFVICNFQNIEAEAVKKWYL